MVNFNSILGFVLIMIAIIIFVFAIPTLQTSLDTDNNPDLENATDTQIEIYSLYTNILFPVMPLVFFVVGAALIFKG